MIPHTWAALERRLRDSGASGEQVEAARVGYEVGVYAGLHQLGQTSDDGAMLKEWHAYYPVAKADAKDRLKAFGRAQRQRMEDDRG